MGHFASANADVPIWALFEVLTLGEFIQVYNCLDNRIKDDIYQELGMPPRIWNKAITRRASSEDLLSHILGAFKSLRNSVAHNSVALDARFGVRDKPSKVTGTYLGNAFGLARVAFDELVDYVLVMVFLMRALGYNKSDAKHLIQGFEKVLADNRGKIPAAVFDRVIGKSYSMKLKYALTYV